MTIPPPENLQGGVVASSDAFRADRAACFRAGCRARYRVHGVSKLLLKLDFGPAIPLQNLKANARTAPVRDFQLRRNVQGLGLMVQKTRSHRAEKRALNPQNFTPLLMPEPEYVTFPG